MGGVPSPDLKTRQIRKKTQKNAKKCKTFFKKTRKSAKCKKREKREKTRKIANLSIPRSAISEVPPRRRRRSADASQIGRGPIPNLCQIWDPETGPKSIRFWNRKSLDFRSLFETDFRRRKSSDFRVENSLEFSS